MSTVSNRMPDVAQTQRSTSKNATSNSLLERIRTRDQDAWRQLTALYGPLAYHWCRNAGLGSEDAADVVQEVFRSLVIHIAEFEKTATSSFRAWLWTIARNKIRDHFKNRKGKAEAAGGTDAQLHLLSLPDQQPNDSADSAVSAIDGLAYRALKIVRNELQKKTWLAFWRSTMDGISPDAVADELGMSIDSVYQAKSRTLRRLRELID